MSQDHLNHYHNQELGQEIIAEAAQLLKLDYKAIRKERFVNGVFCPYCKHSTGKVVSEYVRYGLVDGTNWQRYRCKQCEHIFSDLTRTFFHRSRNVQKWPLFFQLVMIDRLPSKEIAAKLELHINTIYTWKKKLSAFLSLYLPNKQFLPSNQGSYDFVTIAIQCTNKGKPPKENNEPPLLTQRKPQSVNPMRSKPMIPVTVAVNRENPSQILFSIMKDHHYQGIKEKTKKSVELTEVIKEFQAYWSRKRGVNSRNLSMHMTYFRTFKLMEAVNPDILPNELFKICLDNDFISRSNRLLKRLI